jgi:hypothetical protein
VLADAMVDGAGRLPVAVNVTGFPLMPLPAMEAMTTLRPAAGPRVHDAVLASPFASVVRLAPVMVPFPWVTVKLTLIPARGSPFWSRTTIAGGTVTLVLTAEV